MGGGELLAEGTETTPADTDTPFSATTTVNGHLTDKDINNPQQEAEDSDVPMPDKAELEAVDAISKPAATEHEQRKAPKRPTRQAARNIRYEEDGLSSDDPDMGTAPASLDSPTRPTRPAAQKVKVEGTESFNDSTDLKPDILDWEISEGDPDFRQRTKRGATNKYGLTRGYSPYPYRTVPTPEQCDEVHRILVETHGAVIQPAKIPAPSITVTGCGEVRSVLDALLRTRISANTLMPNSNRAIAQLAETYGVATYGVGAGSIDWNAVRLGSLDKLTAAVRVAGTPKLKAGHIKTILDMVYEEQKARAQAHMQGAAVPGAENEDDGQKALEVMKAQDDYLSLEHMRAMTADEAIDEFVKYPGIAVKTAACVVLFCLRIPCFAVDTHVHKMCKWLGWVPEKANETDTFNHGEHMIPNHLKYAFHQLFIRHGQDCFKCRKNTKPGTKAWNKAPACPLEHLLNRNKTMAKGGEEDDDEEEDLEVDDTSEGEAKRPERSMGRKLGANVKAEIEAKVAVASKGAKGQKTRRTSKVERGGMTKKEAIIENDHDEGMGDNNDGENGGRSAPSRKQQATKVKVAQKAKAATIDVAESDAAGGGKESEGITGNNGDEEVTGNSHGGATKQQDPSVRDLEGARDGSDPLLTGMTATRGMDATASEAKEHNEEGNTATAPVIEQHHRRRSLRSRPGL
jgi:endonuclease III